MTEVEQVLEKEMIQPLLSLTDRCYRSRNDYMWDGGPTETLFIYPRGEPPEITELRKKETFVDGEYKE